MMYTFMLYHVHPSETRILYSVCIIREQQTYDATLKFGAEMAVIRVSNITNIGTITAHIIPP